MTLYSLVNLRDIQHIKDIKNKGLGQDLGTKLTPLKPIVQCVDSIPYHHLNFIELL